MEEIVRKCDTATLAKVLQENRKESDQVSQVLVVAITAELDRRASRCG
jgi:hypothetical protein